jgi:carbon-monoxide dehydrogenase medium subunit
MKPAHFDYHRPQTVAEAIGLLSGLGDTAKPIAGGQSLGPMLNMRLARLSHLVDLNDLVELDYVRTAGDFIEIGALTRHHRLATAAEVRRLHPLLAAAAATIGHYPIRQRGTLGGSLAHADPAAQLPLIAVLTGATILVSGPSGRREVAAANFFQSVMTVDLRPGEIITAVRFPLMGRASGWGFELFSRRRGDFAIMAVAALLQPDASGAQRLHLAIGGPGPVPVRLDGIDWRPSSGRAEVREIGRLVSTTLEIEGDERLPAEFRRELAADLTEKTIFAAMARASRIWQHDQ